MNAHPDSGPTVAERKRAAGAVKTAIPRLPAFKAYDIRGRVPNELNATIAYRLGLAYAERYSPRRVAIGRDVRESSPMLARALSLGLTRGGAEVLDLGLCGTEEVRSEEHTSELQSLMRISYAVFCLKKKTKKEYFTQQP